MAEFGWCQQEVAAVEARERVFGVEKGRHIVAPDCRTFDDISGHHLVWE
jgi:hypothetical protein